MGSEIVYLCIKLTKIKLKQTSQDKHQPQILKTNSISNYLHLIQKVLEVTLKKEEISSLKIPKHRKMETTVTMVVTKAQHLQHQQINSLACSRVN